MNTPKKKRKMVPMYSAADFFSGKKDAKPVGWMSDPDKSGLRKEKRNGNREEESMLEEERMFTCLTEEGNRVDGAIEGTKEQVLSWMQNAFPGLRKSEDQEVDTIWAFFRPGEAETYETPDGNKVYLAESFFEVESAREEGMA